MRTLVQKDINGGSWRATNKFINVIGKANVYKLIKPTIIEVGDGILMISRINGIDGIDGI